MGIVTNNIGDKTINSVFVITNKNLGEFDIPDNSIIQLLNNKLQKMINNLDLNNIILLIIDEVSQVTPMMLADFSNQLMQAKNNNLSFGEIPTLLCGDFRQAPLIQEMLLTNAVVKVTKIYKAGNSSKESFLYRIVSSTNIILNHTKSIFLTNNVLLIPNI